MHRRFVSAAGRPVEIRAEEGKPTRLVGYAAVFYNAADPGTEYELMRYKTYRVLERIMPGAFDRAMKEDDCRALFNHDPSCLLGRMRAGTLALSLDNVGLRYEITPPDTQAARDLMESVKRGDLTGSSFSFDYLAKTVRQESETDGSETDIIEVRDVRLYDVGPVTFPAYEATTAGVRMAQADQDAIRRELEALRAERTRNPRGKAARARLLDVE